ADMHSIENEHPSFEIGKEEHFKQMEYCLEQIATTQRQVIELFYLQDKCYREISKSTGIELNLVLS
ncbi:MAG: sigma-70 family RNA polymerase sigma factor, partial [Bacteroidota bacterium]|nr:sigma-70 family RNA polymerase sigma factor [Bacteroidota bacterium]